MIEYLSIVLASTAFGIQHSGISALRVKNWIIDKYGKQGYATIFNVTSVLTLSFAFLSMNFWNWLYFLTPPSLIHIVLIVSGVAAGTIGAVVAMKASAVISVSTVADMRTDRKAELVTDGIYSKVRHPLYLATILVFGAMAMIYPFPNVVIFAVSMIFYTLIGAYLEERKLIIHYGDDYLEYKKQVGFILPRF
ncbi:isoprenylcysteine carboxylmethyltransferase family protein [Candidatus Thorarchaeota archaeon]|nr:MAG: isoprenylcysteine carboxylmethyltransferase family protein [Candidatus Thorarchaeota archaeon]